MKYIVEEWDRLDCSWAWVMEFDNEQEALAKAATFDDCGEYRVVLVLWESK